MANQTQVHGEYFEVQRGAIVVCFPVIAMMIGSGLAVCYQPSDLLRCMASSTAAGILVAAGVAPFYLHCSPFWRWLCTCGVALELLPVVQEHGPSWYAGPLGFASAIVFFSLLSRVLPADDEDTEGEGCSDEDGVSAVEMTPLVSRTSSKQSHAAEHAFPSTVLTVCQGSACAGRSTSSIADIEDIVRAEGAEFRQTTGCIDQTLCRFGPNVRIETANGGRTRCVGHYSAVTPPHLRQILRDSSADSGYGAASASTSSTKGAPVPWTKLFVVALDAVMDGLTLGFTNAVGIKEMALVAAAMTIEMCFVGVSLSCALRPVRAPRWGKLAIVLTVPLGMYLGFLVSSFALHGVDQETDTFVAVIGFAAAALLNLALMELIPESAEGAENLGVPCSEVLLKGTLFSGFVLVMILEKFVDDA